MSYLSYKAERAGRRMVKVDPRNTSKTFVRGRDCPQSLWIGNPGRSHFEVRMPRS
jgi:hypothetical protein